MWTRYWALVGICAALGCSEARKNETDAASEAPVDATSPQHEADGEPPSASGTTSSSSSSSPRPPPHQGGEVDETHAPSADDSADADDTATPGAGSPDAGSSQPASIRDAGNTDDATDDGSQMTKPEDAGSPPDGEKLARVTINAGELDRDHSLVSFSYPAGAGMSLLLTDSQGTARPVQVDAAGQASFVLKSLAAGREANFDLVAAPELDATTQAAEIDGVVRLSVFEESVSGGSPSERSVADFQLGSQPPTDVDSVYARGGYLHPLYTPGGVRLTDDYPDDHYHHHGVWSAWTRASFNGHEVDFWNVQSGQGRVDLEQLQRTWQGPVHAGLEATLVHTDLVSDASAALDERWLVRVYKTHDAGAPYFVMDLDSTQRTATTSPVELLEYLYGGFGVRGHSEWRDVGNAAFLTSEGLDRIEGDGQAARWCYLGGNVDGSPVGYAALGHPDNFRAPQKLRIHASDPFFTFAPVKDGPFTIEPGKPYITRLRFIMMDGPPNVALLERLWNDYAKPATVTVTAAESPPDSPLD